MSASVESNAEANGYHFIPRTPSELSGAGYKFPPAGEVVEVVPQNAIGQATELAAVILPDPTLEGPDYKFLPKTALSGAPYSFEPPAE